VSEFESLKADLCDDIKEALKNPVKPTREQAEQAVDAMFDWVKPFVETSLDRMVKEGVLEREVIGGEEHNILDSLNVESIAWEKPFETQILTLSGDLVSGDSLYPKIITCDLFTIIVCDLFTIIVTIPRKRRANFRPHLRRRLKAVRR